MPKVIKSGIFSPEHKIPETPPAGIKAICKFCNAELETRDGEKKFKLGKKKSNDGTLFVGWIMKCPECGRGVFFLHLGDGLRGLLAKINGHK